ncbi:MAG: cyclase family protein [Acidimicrobiia bacterium]|nr:cyclase family protein [Acidimicrobiia bacterium]
MKFEMAMRHAQLSRRDALKIGAAGAAAVAAGEALLPSVAGAEEHDDVEETAGGGADHRRGGRNDYNDEMFDIEAAKNGAWVPSRYGPEDQRGTFNELTPSRTASALRRLNRRGGVKTYQLGEEMFNGFPAFPSDPPRLHDMFILANGVPAPDDFVAAGGIQGTTAPFGPNEVFGFEERFDANFTFQIATQIDGLNHIGIGEIFYNGFNALGILAPEGTTALGNETMGPIVTRGVILDIIGMKVAAGATDTFFTASNGEPVLNDNYRITIDDIEHAMYRQRIRKKIGPGDVPILRTGWTHVKDDPDRYLALEPGPYLAEARYMADRRVALFASDTWGLEVLDPDVTVGNAFPVHQVLIAQHGVRIGESFVTDDAVADHAYDGVFIATPENVPGATCGSSPPAFLGQPGPAPRG